MRTYTIPFALFHMTVAWQKTVPWLHPQLETEVVRELGLDLGKMRVFLTAGRCLPA